MDMRHITCGSDVRRYGVSPEDSARAEGVVSRYGGTVQLYSTGASCSATWQARVEQAALVTVTGNTYGEALRALSHKLEE